jgi:hypothetical protein
MHIRFDDILEKLGEPKWYTIHGYPRYCDIDPKELSIYAHTAVFYRIACQDCGKRFTVGEATHHMSEHPMEKPNHLHYGDPPRHDCPGAGESMNCDDLWVIQWWERPDREWIRIKSKEVEIRGSGESGPDVQTKP